MTRQEEVYNQKITLLLQKIDDNFFKSVETASGLVNSIQDYNKNISTINASLGVRIHMFHR